MAVAQLDEAACEELLARATVGRIGCRYEESAYVVPVTFAYADRTIVGHSVDGLKLRLMRAAPRVCFEVEEITNLGQWSSVVSWGEFEQLEGAEADTALKRLSARFQPAGPTAGSAHPHARPGASAPTIWAIHLDTITGRAEQPG